MSWAALVCLVAGLATAVVGGVFLAFSDFVMRGLLLAEPAGGIQAMQHINGTVLRSVFLTAFLLLTPVSIGLAAYGMVAVQGGPRVALLFGAGIYLTTVFAVTAFGNVPMNEQLETLVAASPEASRYWVEYGRVWTYWNHLRTLGSVVSASCYLVAAVGL